MGRDGESGKRGRVAGWLLNSVLAVLVTFLVLVVVVVFVVVVRVKMTSSSGEAEARAELRESVRQTKEALSRMAAEGAPLGTRIERALRAGETELAGIRRDGRRTLVTARLSGQGPGVLGPSRETGCYRFTLDGPSVSVRKIADEHCENWSTTRFRPPEEVARDVAAELRTSLARGGLPAAQEADVWSSPGVTVEGERTSAHGLTALVWLYGGTGVLGRDCYEFRVAEGRPANVTFKKLELNGCYRFGEPTPG